eukprot:4584896-Karenia_brevis.AAC.1
MLKQSITVFSCQEDAAFARTVTSTKSFLHASCAGKCSLRTNILYQCGSIVLTKSLAATNVLPLNRHLSVQCAGRYFLVQRMTSRSGEID